MSWCPATAEAVTGDARQAYRPALLNAKYQRESWEAGQKLVQIEGVEAPEACAHD